MRRLMVAIVAILVLAMALAGCSNNAKQAREYMDSADAGYSSFVNQADTLVATLSTVVSDASQIHFDFAPSGSANLTWTLTSSELEEASRQTEKAAEQLQEVKAGYQRITTLSGVQGYTDYANAMIEVVDIYQEAIETARAMLNIMMPQAQAAEAGGAYSVNAGTDDFDKVKSLLKDATKAREEAQAFKAEIK